MTVVVDERYAEAKERRSESELRDVREQFTSAHGLLQGERLLSMLTGSIDAGQQGPSRSTRVRQRRR